MQAARVLPVPAGEARDVLGRHLAAVLDDDPAVLEIVDVVDLRHRLVVEVPDRRDRVVQTARRRQRVVLVVAGSST
jgi:hypothetical protein